MSVHTLHTTSTQDAVQHIKVHLAAALRLAVLDGFEEGIDNHFTACVPGREDQYFVLPLLHSGKKYLFTKKILNYQNV
jgi:hypothetical protein